MPSFPLTRKIGDATVSAIGFGAMGLSAIYGFPGTDEERLKVLDAAYAGGCTFWDTADAYFDCEDIFGQWFKANPEKRKDIFLATKFGFTATGARGDAEYVKAACQSSLSRMGVDYIDLYYQHRVDPNVPIESTVTAMTELVKEGKIKYIGLSDCTAAGLKRAAAVAKISALQIEYSPFQLETEKVPLNLIATAKELGVTIVTYSPLGRGLLTGQYKSPNDFDAQDFRKTLPKFSEANFPKILSLVDKIAEVGKKHNATPGQTTLAWILAQGDGFITIPGTKKIKYLNENLGGAKVTLTPEEVAEIRAAAEATEIEGDRYGPGMQQMIYVDSKEL